VGLLTTQLSIEVDLDHTPGVAARMRSNTVVERP